MNILAARVAAADVDRCILSREALAVMHDRMAACVRRGDPLPLAELADATKALEAATRLLVGAGR